MALACTHVAHAIDGGERVGFFWGQPTADTGRPDAWCSACEGQLLAVPPDQPTGDWFRACDFKILCVGCWDEAKRALYDEPRTTGVTD